MLHFSRSYASDEAYADRLERPAHGGIALRTALAASLLAAPGTALASYGAGHGSVAAFYTPDDGYGHAIVAQSNGDVREVYFTDRQFSSSSVLTNFPGIVSVAGYYTPADHNRHVIVGLSNGQVWEVFYNPAWGISRGLLATIPASAGSIVAVAGWTSTSGQQNAAIATTGGVIYDYQWPNWQLATDGVIGVCANINGGVESSIVAATTVLRAADRTTNLGSSFQERGSTSRMVGLPMGRKSAGV